MKTSTMLLVIGLVVVGYLLSYPVATHFALHGSKVVDSAVYSLYRPAARLAEAFPLYNAYVNRAFVLLGRISTDPTSTVLPEYISPQIAKRKKGRLSTLD